jgi:DNA polymerase I-like protein with 3'-5' exonuclease and polymerase domains
MQSDIFPDFDYQIRGEMDVIEREWHMPSEFPDLRDAKQIAIDLETKDPNIKTNGPGWATKDGHIIGIAVAAGDMSWYFPIRHERGPNMDAKMALRWLQAQVKTDSLKIMHNATYDAGWLRAEGVEIHGKIIDTMITGAVVDENRLGYGLDYLARDYCQIRKDEKLLQFAAKEFGVDPKAEMYKLPVKYVGTYAEQDAIATLKLWDALRAEVERQDLWSIWNLETDLIPCLLDMRTRGVRVDLEKAERNKALIRDKSKVLRHAVDKAAGFEVEIWAANSIAKMFDKLGMEYPRTPEKLDDKGLPIKGTGGAPSFTKDFLNSHPAEVCQQLVKLREFDKADSTFIDTILKHQRNGRIHTELHSTRRDEGGTVTGRFSSSNPNLQQLPARDPDIKKLIRGLFIPEEGTKWGSFDYSSQEPRLLVHFAASIPEQMQDPVVKTIVEEYHRGDVDLHQMVADIAGITRKQAKTVNLGIMYGMGVGKLANQLGISEAEAKSIIQQHQERVPFVKHLATVASQRAGRYGQIRTLQGRLCRFDMWEPSTFEYNKPLPHDEAQKVYGSLVKLRRAFTYKALNRLIQGSAADQTKKAMLDCYKEGLVPMLTVHDELCFSVESEDQAARIKEIMETGTPLKIPSKIDQALADNWGEVE